MKHIGFIVVVKTNTGKRNRGSTVIEMTLLIPIILGCLYLYIMSMLYLVEHARVADTLSNKLYESISVSDGKSMNDNISRMSGEKVYINKGVADFEEEYENFSISVRLEVDDSDPVKSLRRWQLIADTIR